LENSVRPIFTAIVHEDQVQQIIGLNSAMEAQDVEPSGFVEARYDDDGPRVLHRFSAGDNQQVYQRGLRRGGRHREPPIATGNISRRPPSLSDGVLTLAEERTAQYCKAFGARADFHREGDFSQRAPIQIISVGTLQHS